MQRSSHPSPSHRLLSLFLLVALLAIPQAGTALAAEGPLPPDTVALPADAVSTPALELARAIDTSTAIESSLAQLQEAYLSENAALLAAFSDAPHVDLAAGAARVILEMAVDPEAQPVGGALVEITTLANGQRAYIEHAPQVAVRADLTNAIAATGATYETAYENLVQVLTPIESIDALADIPGVRVVRLPYPAATTDLPAAPDAPEIGSRTSEGVALTRTNVWNSGGYTGSGVNVAIYDFGFTGWAGAQASGDLPAGGNLVLKDFSATYSFSPDTPGNEHGTACAEIVLDMAPGSRLYLYAFGTDVELGNAINDYRNNVTGRRVATMSVGYVNAGPYDGTGPINDMINSAQSSGILWVNSAGNNQRAHWSGTTTQYASIPDTVAFGAGNIQGLGPAPGSFWNMSSGARITIYVAWNDWNAARTGNQNHVDYDIGLFRWTGSTWSLVASSTANQCTGAARPTEAISYVVPAGGPYNYGVLVQRNTGGGACTNNFGHWMQMHSFMGAPPNQNLFQYTNQCNSLLIPSDGDSAMTVGATFWNQDSTPPLYGLEYFSSLGPRNASGGGAPGTTANKPDVVAPDGVSNVTYGVSDGTTTGNGFFGTSASAPHVAGMAAVVWSRFTAYTQAQVRSYIQANTVKRGDGGACGGTLADPKNNRFGYGRINLPNLTSLDRRLYLPLIMRDHTVAGAPAAPTLNPISNPDGDGNYTVIWTASAGATSYLLQEDDNSGFSSPATAYSGANTSWAASGKPNGTWYYRVRASNAIGPSGWSNTQSVIVSPSATDIVNGNFELGHTGWTEFSTHGWAIITQSFTGSVTARSGTWAAWLGGDYNDTSYIQQQVTVPAARPYLRYYHWIASADACGFDRANVLVNLVSVSQYDLCDTQNTGGWVARSVNLGAYAGQSVQLLILVTTDGSLNSNLFVDDVSFQSSAASDPDSIAPDADPQAAAAKASLQQTGP